MEVQIQMVKPPKKEQVTIECYKLNESIRDIKQFIQSRDIVLEVNDDDKIKMVSLSDIYYMEAVDNRVFIYSAKKTYQIKKKLYELENEYERFHFFRCSKQTIINLMKIVDITPSLNGRFIAKLANGEKVMISRKYVNELFERLRGESYEV